MNASLLHNLYIDIKKPVVFKEAAGFVCQLFI